MLSIILIGETVAAGIGRGNQMQYKVPAGTPSGIVTFIRAKGTVPYFDNFNVADLFILKKLIQY